MLSQVFFILFFYCKTFVKLLGDNICKDNNIVYYFDDRTGLWSSEESNFIYFKISKFTKIYRLIKFVTKFKFSKCCW